MLLLALSKMLHGNAAYVGLVLVTATLMFPDTMQAGAFKAGPTPRATVAEVDRAANPLNLPEIEHHLEVAKADDSPGAAVGFSTLASHQQRMLITGHDGSGTPADGPGGMSFRRRPVQSQSPGLGSGGGGSGGGGSGASGIGTGVTGSIQPSIANRNGTNSGTPVFFNPPVKAGDVSNDPPPKGQVSDYVPSGIDNTDIQGSETNFGSPASDGVSESPLSFPEPGGLTLLSVGIAGLLGWRRRRSMGAS
jgi:hypothetical protein